MEKVKRNCALLVLVSFELCRVVLGQPTFEFDTSATIPGLQVDSATGDIFVTASDRLYRLNSQLQEQASVGLSASVIDRGLSLSSDGATLVVCLTDLSCAVYNTSSLNTGTVRTEVNAIGSVSEDVAVFNNGEEFFTGSIRPVATVGMGDIMIVNNFGRGFTKSSVNNDAAHAGQYVLSFGFSRAFYGGFQRGNYSYFVIFDYDPIITRAFRILRVCNGDCNGATSCGFNALYEASFSCGLSSISDMGRVCGLTVIDDFAGMTGPIVVVSRCEDPAFTRSAVCLVSLDSVNQEMDEKLTSCSNADVASGEEIDIIWRSDARCSDLFPGAVSPLGICNIPSPLGVTVDSTTRVFTGSDSITSSVAVKFGDFSFVFVGTETSGGVFSIFGYDISPGTPDSVFTPFLAQTTSQVHQLSYRDGDTYITVATSSQVLRVDFDTCAELTDCANCTADPNPLCGWCVVENKCSQQSLCQNSTSLGRWTQEPNDCIVSTVTPGQLVVTSTSPPQTVNVTLPSPGLPPALPGESYSCYFSPDISDIVPIIVPAVEITNGTEYSCVIQVNQLGIFLAGFSVGFQSSLFNTPFDLTDGALTVFTCEQGSSCTECLSDNSPCGWCNLNKVCSGSSTSCRNSTQFLELNGSSTSDDLCPLIDNTPTYLQPVRLAQNISLQALNLIAPVEGFTYSCVVNGVDLAAEFINSSAINCLVTAPVLQLGMGTGSDNVIADIRWNGNGVMHSIGSTNGTSTTVLLYDCQGLASGCSSCIGERVPFDQCAWCEGSSSCEAEPECSSNIITNGTLCPDPTITGFSPQTGHVNGGTSITVTGTNLGVSFTDIVSATITLGGVVCTPVNQDYLSGIQFVCRTRDFTTPRNVTFSINIDGRVGMVTSVPFRAVLPTVTEVRPSRGPEAGGSIVTIMGTYLDAGNTGSTTASLGGTSCNVIPGSVTSSQLMCVTIASTGTPVVEVMIDGNKVSDSSVVFTYVTDPNITAVSPAQTIASGGLTLTFTGDRLDIIQGPILQVTLSNGTETNVTCAGGPSIVCLVPSSDTSVLDYQFILDNVPPGSLQLPQIDVIPDPTGFVLSSDSRRFTVGSGNPITIDGVNADTVPEVEINITVAGLKCEIRTVSDDSILCDPTNTDPNSAAEVRVMIGRNINVLLADQLEVISDQLPLIIGVAAGGAAVILFVGLVVMLCCIVCCFKKKSQKNEQKWTNLLNQMELLEIEMADECKRAFTELQTDLDDLMDISDQNLPYRDFRTFAMRFLFPQDGDDHPILKPLQLPEKADYEKVVAQLSSFQELIMDRKFLVIFVRSLEAQGSRFSLNDRCIVASLLMVCFQNDLDYSTEILQTLLSELMSKSMTKNSHPKLLLRRTESVAEKMLANWLAFLLFPYLLENVGEKLFKLFRAIKSHLEKGPVDVITGEAKNSLSEEKLLRHYRSDIKVVDGVVVAESGEEFPVRLLDCDSITQAKEKVLDVLFKNSPVSRRHQLYEIDLELINTGAAGIPLRDQDATNVKDGDWIKVNTLGHYKLDEMSQAHADNPRNPIPKFRITVRPERPVSGTSFDFMGTIISNMAVGNRTSMIMPDIGTIYHLVKPDPEDPADGQRGGKIVSEVFLTRLLSTKRILQPYVDDLFESIFAIPQGRQVPKAIKSLFDFLDQQAAELGIQDPEILHTWKTNSVPLRFWVNVIKNPDFLFDINKSATVDACLTVIAQAYIDACSTTEFKYTKDTPAARLLYVNDVKKYKQDVQQFYGTVQSQPIVSQSEMCAYLRETTQVCAQSVEQYSPELINEKPPIAGPAPMKGQLYFTTESSLYELFKFAAKFSEEVTEGLNEEGLILQSAKFDQIRRSMRSAT